MPDFNSLNVPKENYFVLSKLKMVNEH